MPEHDKVIGGPCYPLPGRYTLHTRHCHHTVGAHHVAGSLSLLMKKGYAPSMKCMTITYHELGIEYFARGQLASTVNCLASEHGSVLQLDNEDAI